MFSRLAPQPHWNTATVAPTLRGERQQEADRGLQRHDERAEHRHQQDHREADDDEHERDERAAEPVRDVDLHRGRTGDRDRHPVLLRRGSAAMALIRLTSAIVLSEVGPESGITCMIAVSSVAFGRRLADGLHVGQRRDPVLHLVRSVMKSLFCVTSISSTSGAVAALAEVLRREVVGDARTRARRLRAVRREAQLHRRGRDGDDAEDRDHEGEEERGHLLDERAPAGAERVRAVLRRGDRARAEAGARPSGSAGAREREHGGQEGRGPADREEHGEGRADAHDAEERDARRSAARRAR